jgi:hypothetical protein
MILTPDNEYAAVLDACVLLPMPLCDTLLRLAEAPSLYRPLWSSNILEEVERNLGPKIKLTPEQVKRRITVMRLTFPEAEIFIPPEHRHVLAAADRGGAHAIVTLNVKHFPEDCLQRFDILCQTPDEFLVHQYHISPDIVIEKIDDQAANTERTRAELARSLTAIAPEFAKLISA